MRMSHLFEAVVQDDDTAEVVVQILKEVADTTDDLWEFMETANLHLATYRIKLVNSKHTARAEPEWIAVPVSYDVPSTIAQFEYTIGHELVHREQFKAVERDYPGTSVALNLKWERDFGYHGGSTDNIDRKKYYNLPQEVMAYAKMDADEWTKSKRPGMPRRWNELRHLRALYHYLTPESRKRFWSYFAAYMARKGVNKV
jgi:hypothetical protein